MQHPFSLSGKKVLVTGASSGIGRSIAVQSSNQGADMLLSARDLPRLEETNSLLARGNHAIYVADLSLDDSIVSLADRLPELDGLVLNAGMVKTLPVKFITRETLETLFNVNFNGSVLLVQRLIRQKKIRKGASVCFISSVSSGYAQMGNSVYSATKGAVNSFTRSLALELAPNGIRVNAILPGFVETGILGSGPIGQEQLNEHKKNFPAGRFGKPEDVAYLAVYLLSDASEWMTGSLLTIDGGYSIK
ncbi:MAG: SDR family oxidoreductase [Bacteroidota bacterium]